MPLDDILNARFDEEGRLAGIGRGARQRVADRLEPRPPSMSPEELERAVQKLAKGLEEMERQSAARRSSRTQAEVRRPDPELARWPDRRSQATETSAELPRPRRAAPAARTEAVASGAADGVLPAVPARAETSRSPAKDAVSGPLDRLEAMLDTLSRRLEEREAGKAAAAEAAPLSEEERRSGTERRAILPRAHSPERRGQSERRGAAARTEIRPLSADVPNPAVELAPTPGRESLSAVVARLSETQSAAAPSTAEIPAVKAEPAAAPVSQAPAAEAPLAAQASAPAQVPAPTQGRNTQLELLKLFSALEKRIASVANPAEASWIEPMRQELLGILRHMESLARDGHSVSGAVDDMRVRMRELETTFKAARNMAGNRLAELQDKITDLTDRLGDESGEPPVFDELRRSQADVAEKIGRVEDAIGRMASPAELTDKLETLRQQLRDLPSLGEVARIEEQLLRFAERLDALPQTLSDHGASDRIEAQLQGIASEVADLRRLRHVGAAEIEARLSELADRLDRIRESAGEVDLSRFEVKISGVSAEVEEGRRAAVEAIARLDKHLGVLAEAIEKQEGGVSPEAFFSLIRKMDAMQAQLVAKNDGVARHDIAALDGKLDSLRAEVAEQGKVLSAPQLEPLERGLEEMQATFDDLVATSEATQNQLGPVAQQLKDISERLSDMAEAAGPGDLADRLTGLEKGLAGLQTKADSKALATQLEGIVRKLDWLNGKTTEPARMAESFARLEAVVREGSSDKGLDRIEKRLDAIDPLRLKGHLDVLREEIRASRPDERLARIEKKLDATDPVQFAEYFETLRDEMRATSPDARLVRIEQKLDQSDPTQLSDHIEILRDDIRTANPDERLARIEKKLDTTDVSRIADLFDRFEANNRADHDARFARLEEKIEIIGRSLAESDDMLQRDEIADLHNDISALRRELRSLPSTTEKEGNLSGLLTTVAQRLQQVPTEQPLTARDLDEQVERITRILEDPARSGAKLSEIESSLRVIESKLDSAPAPRFADADDRPSSGDAEAVAEVARALSDEVDALRNATQSSDRKTRESLEAVQDTLEAVVKRMAFLEREDELDVGAKGTAPEIAVPPRLDAVSPRLDAAIASPAEVDESEDADDKPGKPSQGLLGRLTSRQLLRRATGGRTDSFSLDESDDLNDLPLEPGTDSPLSSPLTGAPSSDTAIMSGARPRPGRAETNLPASGSLDETAPQRTARGADPNDFLAAARRAAQAASLEPSDTETPAPKASAVSRIFSSFGSRHKALVAGALTVAVAFAALQYIRKEIGTIDVATLESVLPESVARLVTGSPASETEQPEVAAVVPETVPEAPVTSEQVSEPVTADAVPEPPAPALTETTTAEAAPGAAESDNTAPAAARPEPTVTAALPAPAVDSLTAAPAPPPPELPDSIGPADLRTAALSGDAGAAFEIAVRFAEGRGVPRDPAAAVEWYERAAQGGMPVAQYRLGSIYENGMGAAKDLAKAQKWYKRAADAGNVKSMHNLAVLYAEGAGGDPDLKEAVKLFDRAAEYGVRDSQFNIAILHARGLGVPQDLIEAYKWFSIAADQGDPEAAKRRDAIAGTMSVADLAKGKAAAAGFEPLPADAAANEVAVNSWGPPTTAALKLTPEVDITTHVQELLVAKGFDIGKPDGKMGQRTRDAIVAFRKKVGLPVSGDIDPGLVQALEGGATSS